MKKFILHGEMAGLFCKEAEYNVNTMREMLEAFSANYPGFKSYFTKKIASGIDYQLVDKNGSKYEQFCADMELIESEYDLIPTIQGSAMAGMAFLGNFALGYGMEWLSSKLGPQDDGTPEYEIITTNSKIYSKNENRVEQGVPVPVVYGQLRIGSHVIHSSIHNYDYDYDEAQIYPGKPIATRLSKLQNGADYKFINSNDIQDLRNGTPEFFNGLMDAAADATKRFVLAGTKFNQMDGQKKFNALQENESMNEAFQNAGDGSNKRRHFGPSEGVGSYTEAGESWWDRKSLTPRPFLYPVGDSIDKNMRPAGEGVFSIERESKAGVVPPTLNQKCLGFKNPTTPLTVGSRGSYHKLESIGIYKSLEILSEGPIAGLANPITGLDRDNGFVNYPYEKSDFSVPAGAIELENLQYDLGLNGLISSSNSAPNHYSVDILDSGGTYTYPNGTYNITGDGTQNVLGMTMKVDRPKSMKTASIQDTSFYKGDEDGDGIPDNVVPFINNNPTADTVYYSDNRLFLLSEADGVVVANGNSTDTIPGYLPTEYLNTETTAFGTNSVFDLALLEANKETLYWDNTNFKKGKGYGVDGFSFTVSPDSEDFDYTVEIEELSSFRRTSQAQSLDLGYFFAGRESNPTFSDEVDQFLGSAAVNVPNTNTSWSNIARIYSEGTAINLNSSITLTVGTWTRRSGFNTITENVNVTITMLQYLNFDNVTATNVNSGARVSGGYEIWNNDAADETNLFESLVRGTAQPLGILLRNAAFANAVYNAFNAQGGNNLQSSIIPTFTITKTRSLTYGGGAYLKYGVGSGSTRANGTLLAGTTLSRHIFDLGNDNFNSVRIMDPGAIKEDDSSSPKGYYSPFLSPRVTVFILRKTESSSFTSFRFIPTDIDAVAEINASGLVDQIHLLRVPDNPVIVSADVRSPIMPAGINNDKPVILGSTVIDLANKYEDIGVFCMIDPSNNSESGEFIIDNQQLTFNAINGSLRHLISTEDDWTEHIELNSPSPNNHSAGAGLFVTDLNSYNNPGNTVSTDFTVQETSQYDSPTARGTGRINIESIDISNVATYKVNQIFNAAGNANYSTICTGRPASIQLINAGAGYALKNGDSSGKRLPFDIRHLTYGVQRFQIGGNGNIGYRPNTTFYGFGISSRFLNRASNTGSVAMHSCKIKFEVDDRGKISNNTIIDQGFGFSPLLDPNDFVFSFSATSYADARDRGFLGNFHSSNAEYHQNQIANINFTKQDLILTIDDSHLSVLGQEGSVSKFYIRQNGIGFNRNQILFDQFQDIPYSPPIFNVTINNNAITAVAIDPTSNGNGYSVEDGSVGIKCWPPPSQTIPVNNDPNADDLAWGRSVFLNDVPIRDRNDRFNYSKFHFDMRIGHGKNGNGESNLIGDQVDLIAPGARPNMISDEFKLPSYTKMIDYDLYGPRNENDKDYYYTHTIKNPEVSTVALSIKVNELHYIYEGDEAAVYVNLIPLMMAAIGFVIADAIKEGIASALIQDPVTVQMAGGTGIGQGVCPGMPIRTTVTGASKGFTDAPVGEAAKSVKMIKIAASIAGGAVGGALTFLLVKIFPCSKIQWLCFKIGELIKNSGEIWPAKMRVAIEYGVEGEDLKKDIIAFNGCATNPYVKDILIDNLPKASGTANNFKNRIIKVYRTTREVDPVSGGIVEARYKLGASLQSVTEYVEGFFGYPNTAIIGTRLNAKDHPDIPNKEYLIKGRMIKVPSNYNPIDGTYSGDWNGNFKYTDLDGNLNPSDNEYIMEWTSNPAWIIYDLLTNKRYGMGKYNITDEDIDKWSFYQFSKFCDEQVDVVIDGVQTQERRHMCNLYVDSESQAYDYIKDLLNIYNSTINFSGGKIYINTDYSEKNKNGSIMLFNNSNISESGFSYSSTPETSRITSATVDYLDERDNYMSKSEYVEDNEGIKEHGYSHVRIPGVGITRRGEAHRLAWHKILSRQLEKEVVAFEAGLQASYLRIGDIIEILDKNKVERHSGGRIMRVINSTTVELDIPVSALGATTVLYIEKPTLSDNNSATSSSSQILDRRSAQFEEYTINSSSGFNVTFNSTLDSSITEGIHDKGISWIIKEDAASEIKPKKYKVIEINESANLNYKVGALEYLEEKYDYIDKSTSSKDGIYLEEREYKGHVIDDFTL